MSVNDEIRQGCEVEESTFSMRTLRDETVAIENSLRSRERQINPTVSTGDGVLSLVSSGSEKSIFSSHQQAARRVDRDEPVQPQLPASQQSPTRRTSSMTSAMGLIDKSYARYCGDVTPKEPESIVPARCVDDKGSDGELTEGSRQEALRQYCGGNISSRDMCELSRLYRFTEVERQAEYARVAERHSRLPVERDTASQLAPELKVNKGKVGFETPDRRLEESPLYASTGARNTILVTSGQGLEWDSLNLGGARPKRPQRRKLPTPPPQTTPESQRKRFAESAPVHTVESAPIRTAESPRIPTLESARILTSESARILPAESAPIRTLESAPVPTEESAREIATLRALVLRQGKELAACQETLRGTRVDLYEQIQCAQHLSQECATLRERFEDLVLQQSEMTQVMEDQLRGLRQLTDRTAENQVRQMGDLYELRQGMIHSQGELRRDIHTLAAQVRQEEITAPPQVDLRERETEVLSLPEGCSVEEAKRRITRFFTALPPKYSAIFQSNPHGEEPEIPLETGYEQTSKAPSQVADDAPRSLATPVAEPSVRNTSGFPVIGNKFASEVIGKYAEDNAQSTLTTFIQKVDMYAETEHWSDTVTGRVVKACLAGRALDTILSLRESTSIDSWVTIQRALVEEMYSAAYRRSAEVRLEKAAQETNEGVRVYSNRIYRLAQVAYYNRSKKDRDEIGVKAFLRGLKNLDLRYHLEDRMVSGQAETLRSVCARAETWLAIRSGERKEVSEETEGGIRSVQGSRPSQNFPRDSRSGSRRGRGRGRGRGSKTPTREADTGSNADLLDKLRQLLNQQTPVQEQTCHGKCFRCGRPGHRRAECPQGRFCTAKSEITCSKGSGSVCACLCKDHSHFGFGHSASTE